MILTDDGIVTEEVVVRDEDGTEQIDVYVTETDLEQMRHDVIDANPIWDFSVVPERAGAIATDVGSTQERPKRTRKAKGPAKATEVEPGATSETESVSEPTIEGETTIEPAKPKRSRKVKASADPDATDTAHGST